MGEYADMVLDGDACSSCGTVLSVPGDGIPRTCRECRRADNKIKYAPTLKCQTCGKKIKRAGIADHKAAKHGV